MLDLRTGNCLDILPQLAADSVQCCVTSPPYWGLRDYGVDGQFGLEETPEAYVANMIKVFREVRRVLRDGGTLWLNLGDSYANGLGGPPSQSSTLNHGKCVKPTEKIAQLKPLRKGTAVGFKRKDLVGIPWRVAFALQADGWYLRSDIIWHKPNPMPESVTDRPTRAHEYIFLFAKSEHYFFDAESIYEQSLTNLPIVDKSNRSRDRAVMYGIDNGPDQYGSIGQVKEGFRNRRSVWTLPTQPYSEAHFATFPEELPKLCILAGSKPGDTILDPFAGSGTVGQVALELARKAILIEINPDYVQLAKHRTWVTPGLLF